MKLILIIKIRYSGRIDWTNQKNRFGFIRVHQFKFTGRTLKILYRIKMNTGRISWMYFRWSTDVLLFG